MKAISFQFLCLLLSLSICAQSNPVDSLEQALKDATVQKRIDLKNRINEFLGSIFNPDERLELAQKYREISEKLGDSLLLGNSYFHLHTSYSALGEFEKSREAYKEKQEIQRKFGWYLLEFREENVYWYNHLNIFRDDAGTSSFERVRANEDLFTRNNTRQQFFNEDIYWAKIILRGHPTKEQSYLFHFAQNDYFQYSWQNIDAWLVHENGDVVQESAGLALAKREKVIPSHHNLIRFVIRKDEKAALYVRLNGVKSWDRPDLVEIGLVQEDWWPKRGRSKLIEGLMFGAIGIQILYFLLLLVIEKDRIHFYYIILILGLLLITNKEFSFDVLPWSRELVPQISLTFGGIFLFSVGIVKFAEIYFRFERDSLFSRRIIAAFIFIGGLGTIFWNSFYFSQFFQQQGVNPMTRFTFAVMGGSLIYVLPLLGFGLSVYRIRELKKANQKYEKFYLFAFILVLVITIVALFYLIVDTSRLVQPSSYLLERLYPYVSLLSHTSVILMLIFLSFSNGFRTNQLKDEKQFALQKNLDDQKRINAVISRFVPNEFIRSLGKRDIREVSLGDHVEQTVTVLFSDIRSYTTLSEQMTPAENFEFVQAYNSVMGPIIRANDGFVNQYLGDGIMAIFPRSPDDALGAAIGMQQALEKFNANREHLGNSPIRVGIGMHTGSLIMGIIGDEDRMDAATISDTVNTAARIESLTKEYGVPILISGAGIKHLVDPGNFDFKYVDEVKVKGKSKLIKIYECSDRETAKNDVECSH